MKANLFALFPTVTDILMSNIWKKASRRWMQAVWQETLSEKETKRL